MIYFDNSATTAVVPEVLETYRTVSEKIFGNPSSLHALGETSQRLLQQARTQIAAILGTEPSEIFFTSGGTEGDNWAIKGTAFEKREYGKHIITTTIEHPAVRETMEQLEGFGFEVTYLPVTKEGVIRIEELKAALRDDTILVSIMGVNNEIGSIQPLEEIAEVLKDYPTIHFHVDAVQTIGKIPLNLGSDGRIDLATFSGHKFHAPRGVGVLYIRKGKRIQPLLTGGGQERGQRSGTENLPAISAMAKAMRILYDDVEGKNAHMRRLTDRLKDELKGLEKVVVFTPEHATPHIVCFGISGIRGEVLVHALEEKEIFVSTTSACSSRKGSPASTLRAMKIPSEQAESAIRVSLSEYNTVDEMTIFIEAFNAIYNHFEEIII